MVALHDAIENGVGDRRIADPGMPVLDRELTGNDRGLVGGGWPKVSAWLVLRYSTAGSAGGFQLLGAALHDVIQHNHARLMAIHPGHQLSHELFLERQGIVNPLTRLSLIALGIARQKTKLGKQIGPRLGDVSYLGVGFCLFPCFPSAHNGLIPSFSNVLVSVSGGCSFFL